MGTHAKKEEQKEQEEQDNNDGGGDGGGDDINECWRGIVISSSNIVACTACTHAGMIISVVVPGSDLRTSDQQLHTTTTTTTTSDPATSDL